MKQEQQGRRAEQQQVASMDEVGRDSNDDAEGRWVLEQEALMGGNLWQPRFRATWHGHKWTP
jgi:hypothetical protein